MQKGISVWLDVPLEALARRITAVGTNSRPLLHHESGDPYLKVGCLPYQYHWTSLGSTQVYMLQTSSEKEEILM